MQTRMEQRGRDYNKMSFDFFQIQKWMLQTVRVEKVGHLWGRLSELWSLNCPKKCICCYFVLTWARNLSLWKQFTYMQLKVFTKLFQKMVWFIGAWGTVHEILATQIPKKMLTQQKFHRIILLQILISPKQ